MGPEQDETKPAGVRQYATTLHAPGQIQDLVPPDGEDWDLEGLQSQDDAGNLVYLWSRLRPGLHAIGEHESGKVPLCQVQAVAQLVLEELRVRFDRQLEASRDSGQPFLDGLIRGRRLVGTFDSQIGEAQLPESLGQLVE